MTRAGKSSDDVEALLRQTLCNDLSLVPNLGYVWAGLRERIVGPRAGHVSASRASSLRRHSGTEAEEVGLSRTT